MTEEALLVILLMVDLFVTGFHILSHEYRRSVDPSPGRNAHHQMMTRKPLETKHTKTKRNDEMINKDTITRLLLNTKQFQVETDDYGETIFTPRSELQEKNPFDMDKVTFYIDGIVAYAADVKEISIEENQEETAVIVHITSVPEDPYYYNTFTLVIPMYSTRELSIIVRIEDTIVGGAILGENGEIL